MIPKVTIFTLTGAGDFTILTVPVNKVIEIHEINVDNQDVINHNYTAKLQRAITPMNLRDQVAVGFGQVSPLTSANKKVIAMDGDLVIVGQNEVNDTFLSTVSLHYTEWDVGEVPNIEPKSLIGLISNSFFQTALSTSVAIPRLVIRDYLVHNSTGQTAITRARLHTSAIDNEVEHFSLAPGLVHNGSTQRWVLEQNGATVMDWQHLRTGVLGSIKFILSYIEHSDP